MMSDHSRGNARLRLFIGPVNFAVDIRQTRFGWRRSLKQMTESGVK
jgi:hypothetical protein